MSLMPLHSSSGETEAVRLGIRIAQIGFVVCLVSVGVEEILKMERAAGYVFYVGAGIMFVGIITSFVRLMKK